MALPDNYRRANELVGQYMNTWAVVELGVVNVISAAFMMDGMLGGVIGLNTTVREKIAIARTGITLSMKSPTWRAMADQVLRQVADASTDRNMVAHTLFDAPENGDGAVFLHRSARAGLRFDDIHWSNQKFAEIFGALMSLRHHLDDIEADLRLISPELIRQILDGQNPTLPPLPPDRLSVVLHQPQDEESSDQPKPKPKRERKPERREKEVQALRAQVAELRAELAAIKG